MGQTATYSLIIGLYSSKYLIDIITSCSKHPCLAISLSMDVYKMMMVFVLTQSRLVGRRQCFRETYCFQIHGWRWKSMWHQNPKEHHHPLCHKNLKSQVSIKLLLLYQNTIPRRNVWSVEVKLHTFLTWALVGGDWRVSCSSPHYPLSSILSRSQAWSGCDGEEVPYPCWESNPTSRTHSHSTYWAIPQHVLSLIK
jgi:hypothetical protein